MMKMLNNQFEEDALKEIDNQFLLDKKEDQIHEQLTGSFVDFSGTKILSNRKQEEIEKERIIKDAEKRINSSKTATDFLAKIAFKTEEKTREKATQLKQKLLDKKYDEIR